MNKTAVQEKKNIGLQVLLEISVQEYFFALNYRENWQNLFGPFLKGYIQHTFTFQIFNESCVLFNARLEKIMLNFYR